MGKEELVIFSAFCLIAIITLLLAVRYMIYGRWWVTQRDVNISGAWQYEFILPGAEHMPAFSVEVVQRARKIECVVVESGTASYRPERQVKTFRFEGYILNGFLTLTKNDKAVKESGALSMFLEIKNSGKEMIGYINRYNVSDNEFVSDPVIWKRIFC